MRKNIVLIWMVVSLFMILHSCNNTQSGKIHTYRIPRVAVITTGVTQGNGILPPGVIIAHQYFNSQGVVTLPVDRTILLNPRELATYDILIISTSAGYHDADRMYSLTYMSDEELSNLEHFVNNGGYLIAGDNVGRNNDQGEDRISLYGKLTAENWPLSKCFGVTLEEKNMKGFCIVPAKRHEFYTDTFTNDLWILVPDSILSDSISILAYWKTANSKIPAILENNYGKGKAFLFASSYFLHPSNRGGFSDIANIEKFYKHIMDHFYQPIKHPVKINPWPANHPYAFSLTLNADGNLEEFKRIINLASQNNMEVTAFVSGNSPSECVDYMLENKINLASSGYSQTNFKDKNYSGSLHDITHNEVFYNRCFKGFRFPFTITEPASLLVLSEKNYRYESSLGFGLEYFTGSVFPYKIPINHNGFFKISQIIEISPVYHDDYFYFNELEKNKSVPSSRLYKSSMLYKDYLLNTLEHAVKNYNGQFTWIGHPCYSGFSDTTILALEGLVNKAVTDKAWLTTPYKMATFRSKIEKLNVFVTESKDAVKIEIECEPGINISDFSIRLKQQPKKITLETGKYKTYTSKGNYYVSFTAINNQILKMKF